jgi:hypothetical protein
MRKLWIAVLDSATHAKALELDDTGRATYLTLLQTGYKAP